MGCPQESRCELLPLLQRELPLRLWHDLYCEGAHDRCTRLRLVHAGVTPAPELLPDGRVLEAAGDGPGARDDVTDSIDLAAALSAGPAR